MCYQFCETRESISVLYATTYLLHSLYNRFSIKFKVMKKFFKLSRLTKTITHSYKLKRIRMIFSNYFAYRRAKTAIHGMLFGYNTAASFLKRSKNGLCIEGFYTKGINHFSRNTFLCKRISRFKCLIDFHTASNKCDIGSFAQYVGFAHFQFHLRGIYRWHTCATHSNIHRTRGFCSKTNCGAAGRIIGWNKHPHIGQSAHK